MWNIFRILKIKTMQEIWKDIKGYQGLYQVSNKGRIKSLARYITVNHVNNGNYTYFQNEKILTPKGQRYLKVALRKDGKKHWHSMHRLIAIHFIPNPQNKPEVNHINGNKQDNAISNLEWNTSSENKEHAYRIGLMKSNLINWNKKL